MRTGLERGFNLELFEHKEKEELDMYVYIARYIGI